MWHDTGSAIGVLPSTGDLQPGSHLYHSSKMRRIKNHLDGHSMSELLHDVPFGAASSETLHQFHTEEYVRRVALLSAARGGDAGDSAIVGPGTDEIARLSAGAACSTVEAVATGVVDNAYALTFPAGHHAEREQGRGFCIYGNVALAIMEAKARGHVDRVAILDWDVHHGNGTQQAFYDSDDVLMISIHQEMLYPFDMGTHEEQGEKNGDGFNINIPLPAGCGGGAYMAAMERVVLPALSQFKPDMIVVSSGLDAGYFDPMSHMLLVSEHYREMTRLVKNASAELCDGKLAIIQEGGYSDFYLPFCAGAIVEELMEHEPFVEDVFAGMAGFETQTLKPHQDAYIEQAVNGPVAKFMAVS